MSRSIAHRGPDDDGSFLDAGVGLAARRLSIIDVEGGHQPITNEDRTIWIVFNGEIYNHERLRLLLSKLGHRFQTRADTEAVVHAYEEFGPDWSATSTGCSPSPSGTRKPKLFLARDRFGIKPLLRTLVGELIFGSS
jgi:asparagine synthase (glutamine-hydrolysing)